MGQVENCPPYTLDPQIAVIDGLWRNVLVGWVKHDGGPVSLTLYLRGKVVGTGSLDFFRDDLAGEPEKSGFKIVSDTDCSVSDFASGDLFLEANFGGCIYIVPLAKFIRSAAYFEKSATDFSPRALDFVKASALEVISNVLNKHPQKSSTRKAVGIISGDGAAITGYNGSLFVYGGRNSLVSMYSEPEDSFTATAAAWRKLIQHRMDLMADAGARYIQVFIPEKSSICSQLAPFPVQGVSGLWRKVVDRSVEESPQSILDAARTFNGLADPSSAYRLLDSHLSHRGAEAIVLEFINYLGLPIDFSAADLHCLHAEGDLSRKFPVEDLSFEKEKFIVARGILNSEGRTCEPELIGMLDPEEGHIGMKRTWICPAAPIKKKVMVFGNSFFERGGNSTSLSWWFARVFSEYHFIWSPEFMPDEIESVAPDLVVGQSIERFLRVVPLR